MKNRMIALVAVWLTMCNVVFAQDSVAVLQHPKEYPFILMDSPARLSTMRQSNENTLSAYRLAVTELNKYTSRKVSCLIQLGVTSLFVIPLTHEEGHRSVLTSEHIGSVSQPFFNKDLVAYVNGVRDSDLKTLRDTKLPTYIRLHTAGLESDHALLLHEASLLNFDKESNDVLQVEYLMRKISLISYYAMGLLKMDAGIKEEADELKRDIVGHDVYGAIRHIHRPDMEFYRYTNYDDLTGVEKKFVRRVGWRSLLNLVDPILIGKTGFDLSCGYRFNFNVGYGMAPFGDYIEQNVWLQSNTMNAQFYLREFQNQNTWFPALGAKLHDVSLGENMIADATLHAWLQPQNLSFGESKASAGGAIELVGKYKFALNRNYSISANLGITAKTKGFLLEEMAMDNHVGIRIGTSLWIR